MALNDKLNTIDTIDNLATNRDFLGKLITELSKGANNAGIYTKKGVDDELKKKADKNYVDIELGKKANSADLAAKANTTDVYTKKNVDDELAKKADTAALTNKADKNYVDTELGKKANSADLAAKANTADVYTKKNVDDELAKKADKNYVDTELGRKANSADLAAKANTADVYTKKNVDDELAKKADTAALTNKADKNYVDTELGKKAGAADLANKANTADVYTKAAADTAFVKATELKTKAAAKDVVDAIFDAKDGNNKISETKIGATFAKKTDLNDKVNVLGDNATEAGVKAMLDKLSANEKVLKVDGSNATDPGVNAMLGKLTDKVVKTGELATKVAEKAVVDVLVPALATVGTDDTKKVYTKETANTEFVKTSELAKKVAEKAVMDAIFDAKDGNKSILVNKLEGFLAENAKAYSNNTKTAKELLAPSAADLATELAKNDKFIGDVEKMAVSSNPKFQSAVREVMSQPSFEIPTSDDAALNWTW